MNIDRRRFFSLVGATAAISRWRGASTLWASAPDAAGLPSGSGAGQASPPPAIDALFDRSTVVDALSVDEDWNEQVLAAVHRSGLTAIHTSLANANLQVALRDLGEWQARFDRYPDRLSKVVRASHIVDAKKTNRLAVLLGFQNATMIGSD